jgi:hypothetical protein
MGSIPPDEVPRFIEMTYDDFKGTVSACLKHAFIKAMASTGGPSAPGFADAVLDDLAKHMWELMFSTVGLQGWKPSGN